MAKTRKKTTPPQLTNDGDLLQTGYDAKNREVTLYGSNETSKPDENGQTVTTTIYTVRTDLIGLCESYTTLAEATEDFGRFIENSQNQ